MRPLFVIVAALALSSPALGVTVHSIPDPRPGSRVVDLQHVLSPAEVQAIDALAERARAGGELMVVVVDTTAGVEPRAFATSLFNRFGLDSGERNRGVILFAALQDRAAEIVVGDGFPAGVTLTTDRIMGGVVVAHFRSGDPKGAMVEGARALVDDLLLAADKPAPSELPAGEQAAGGQVGAMQPLGTPVGEPESPPASGLQAYAHRNPIATWGWLGGGLFGIYLGVRRILRNRPRNCRRCGQKMVRLDEVADDAFLSSAEKAEERVGSVDYDIWMCRDCQETLKLRYGALFTSYSKCSSCGAKTLKTTTTTIVPATEHSTGTARVEETCEHCHRHNSYTRTIPRRPKPSSSSHSSSRSSFGGGSSRGSSSGRGSSGRW